MIQIFSAGRTGRDGTDGGSTRGPRGPKNLRYDCIKGTAPEPTKFCSYFSIKRGSIAFWATGG